MNYLKELIEDGFVFLKKKPDLKRVYIEVTNRCNLNCITCIRNSWCDSVNDLEFFIFSKIIEELKDFKDVKEFYFGGFGEPLSHLRILEMIELAKKSDLKVTVSSNGVLLDRNMVKALVKAKLDQIVVSFDSAQPQQYGNIRVGSSLTNVVANIHALNEEKMNKRSHLPKIGIEFVAMKRNIQEIPAMSMLARTLGASFVIVTNILPHTEDMIKEVLYDGEHKLPEASTWPVYMKDWLLWGMMEFPKMKWGAFRRCRFMESHSIVIASDGVVSPCYPLLHSYSYYILGRKKNVKKYHFGKITEKSLMDIYTSDEFLKFRYRVRNFNFPSCVDCDLNPNCDYASSNTDCWGGDPSCADCLYAQDIVKCP